MARVPVLLAGLVVISASLATPVAAQLRGEVVVSGLRTPVAVVADPTDRAILLIAEQEGLIRIARGGALLAESFLDLRSEISSGGERGLLGFALAPDYADSRRVFVNFTNRNGDTVVARFERNGINPLAVDPASRLDLRWSDGRRSIDQPFANHNGGHLAFGPDGYLYIGLGDGGSGGDPLNLAQNPDALLGKMLRIDVNVPVEDLRGFRVPEDNPFLDGDPVSARPEIWAFGFRNPWRYSFDDWTRGGTGALTIGDVGQDAREEINFEPAGRGGRNYGWRLREGRAAYDARTAAAFLPLAEPIHDYTRSFGASITGGLVYRGAALDPTYNGRYFYADFVSGRLFSIGMHLDPLTSEAAAGDQQEHTAQVNAGIGPSARISSFGADHDGELLALSYGAGRVIAVTPDFAVVPREVALAATLLEHTIRLNWVASVDGIAAETFVVERVREGVVVDRHATERTELTLDSATGDCFRVRATSRASFSGPPSRTVCSP